MVLLFSRDNKSRDSKVREVLKGDKMRGLQQSGLKKHLNSMHDISLDKHFAPLDVSDEQPSPSSNAKRGTTIQDFSTTFSLDVVIARLAEQDNISFSTICHSDDIRQGLIARGFTNIPKTHRGVKLKVEAYYNIVTEEYRKQL